MSEIQRYDVDHKGNTETGMSQYPNGRYVLFTDHEAALKAAEERAEAKIPEVMLSELHYKDGKLDMVASHPFFHILMDEATRMFDLEGATNFLSMTGIEKREPYRHFDIVIQLQGGKTPAEKLNELHAEVTRLTQELAEARRQGEELVQFSLDAVRDAHEYARKITGQLEEITRRNLARKEAV